MDVEHSDSSIIGRTTPASSDGGEPPSAKDAGATTQPLGQRRPIWHRLFDPVDNGWLAFFRILFGIEMLYTVWKHFDHGRVLWYSEAPFLFKYYGFEWVHAWPGDWLKVHYIILGVLSGCIILGLFYRISMTLFFFGFTYIYLLDQADFLNHYYLVCLLALVMIFIPAHQSLSIDAWLRPRLRSHTAPTWTLWLLRFQVGIPYFFGGIAKLNADWLRGEPMHIWLVERMDNFPLMADFFATREAGYFFSYGGLFFDLFIIPMLLWPRTRLLGYAMAVFFHVTNSFLFGIGIFPWMMMLASLIYFSPELPRRLLRKLARVRPLASPRPAAASERLDQRQRRILAVLGVYLAFQCLFPLRHFLYSGNVSWTEDGHRFAWHMMLRTKRGYVRLYAHDPTTGLTFHLDPTDYLSFEQRRDLAGHPDMIRQFAHFLANEPDMQRELRKRGLKRIEIRADGWVTLNGRIPQRMIDPNVDLSRQPRTLWSKSWVLPLTEPFRYDEPFGIGRDDWNHFLAKEQPLPF
jgi:hypothetical protein